MQVIWVIRPGHNPLAWRDCGGRSDIRGCSICMIRRIVSKGEPRCLYACSFGLFVW